MARMTDDEAKYWDDYYTKNPPKPGPNGTGYFTQCKKNGHTLTQRSQTDYFAEKLAEAEQEAGKP